MSIMSIERFDQLPTILRIDFAMFMIFCSADIFVDYLGTNTSENIESI